MSTRTYCVIPHEARQTSSFFQGVFEDGLQVLYRGRQQSFVLSHVLSPAHDYVKHLNGPLLATLREGGNATLILATPSSEAAIPPPSTAASSHTRAAVRTVPSVAAATPPSASSSSTTTAAGPAPTPGQQQRTGLTEATAVAMELYANLFPLLFRNLDGCSAAWLSVLTVSASERVLLDNLHDDRRIHTVQEARRVTVTRAGSASEWGMLLQLLEDRHAALEASPTSLEAQTACVVTVELQDYGRLVVVDTASAQDLLQQLALILHMHADGAARTYPLHTPLRDLLEANVAPRATVQVLGVPAPQDSARQTMRVLHFAATVQEACAATASVGEFAPESRPLRSSSSSSSLPSRPPLARRAAPLAPAASKLFSRPAATPSPEATFSRTASAAVEDTGRHPPASPPATANRTSGEAHHSGSADDSRSRHGSSPSVTAREHTPAQLPPPSVELGHGRHDAQEQLSLRRQLASVEAELRDVTERWRSADAARERAVAERGDVERELRGKVSLWADLQRAHQATRKKNMDYAQVVERLERQVRTLEQAAARQARQDAAVVRQLRQAEAEKEEVTLQLTRLRKELLLFRKDATWRAREATLSRIVPSEAAATHAADAAAQNQSTVSRHQRRTPSAALSFASTATTGGRGGGVRRHSPRARRLYDTSSDSNTGNNSGAAAAAPVQQQQQQERLAAITVDELRWRNRLLEQEVARLQERLLVELTAAARGDAVSGAVDAGSGSGSGSGTTHVRPSHTREERERVREEADAVERHAATSSAPLDHTGDGAMETAGAARLEHSRGGRVTRSPSGVSDARKGSGDHDGVVAGSAADRVDDPVRRVAAALLAGCASLDAQLACAQMVLSERVRHSTATDTHGGAPLYDPVSRLSTHMLDEHQEAVAALARSLRHIADKPATRPAAVAGQAVASLSTLPPIPRCATAADADTLTNHLSFEAERCRHLRAFLPTFAQLAVATEHLVLRIEATQHPAA
ncbi:hypothetical protein NESM_000028600 [Novymonas esmeraldas]|uniref:Kinesin motor domain-containing protein n=1 Tax=Novymonas esmeraldas TaxID=1808958 RepID=A0AAW0F0Z9_9TRYP